jgi:quercetin dioxygenase-like cupin family protein
MRFAKGNLDDPPEYQHNPAEMQPRVYIPSDGHLTPSAVFPDPETHLRVIRIPQHGTERRQHSHAFHELVVILDGQGRHAVGPETYDIAAGDVFVILGDTTHGYPRADHLSLTNILFDPHQLGIPVADLGNLPGYHALFTLEPRFRRKRKFKNRLTLTVEQL